MAIPQGGFSAGAAGITSPGGAYAYSAGAGYPHYFAGQFFIDTGYDDPVLWTTGVDAAEVYGARVYAKTGTISPAPGASVYTGRWHIVAHPVWDAKFWTSPTPVATQQRIFIRCDAYLLEPVSEADGSYQRLDSVDWSLYRV